MEKGLKSFWAQEPSSELFYNRKDSPHILRDTSSAAGYESRPIEFWKQEDEY